jgi:RNA polymerase sigma-70 factor (ECF subfamily)
MTDRDVHSSGKSDQTSSTLLARIQAHEPEAWERFVHLYGPLVYRWCRQAGLQDADAADVGQDVFRAVARAIPTFRREKDGGTLRGWLKKITRNKVRDLARRPDARHRGVGGTDAQKALQAVACDTPDVEEGTDEADRLILLRRAVELVLGDFKEQTRQAFLRVALERHDPADVARDLGMTVNAVYLARSRVMRRIREEYAGVLDD